MHTSRQLSSDNKIIINIEAPDLSTRYDSLRESSTSTDYASPFIIIQLLAIAVHGGLGTMTIPPESGFEHDIRCDAS